MKYEDYVNSKLWSNSLDEAFSDIPAEAVGYIYLDAYWIEWTGSAYYTRAGREEILTANLERAERFLWNYCVRYEVGG